jgi:hypothetical protein
MIPSAATAGRNSGQGRITSPSAQGTLKAQCPLLADLWSLLGVKRTWREGYVMSAYDLKRTLVGHLTRTAGRQAAKHNPPSFYDLMRQRNER